MFLLFSVILFFISILGIFLTRNNLIIILISIELMLIAINMNFVYFSVVFNDILGQLFFFTIIVLAGAEAAIGLGILIIYYRIRGIIASRMMHSLKG